MNTYEYRFKSICPANGVGITYELTIECDFMIRVEQIIEACSTFKEGFQEQIADDLYSRFGGRLTLLANHHGVSIRTVIGNPFLAVCPQ